MVRISALSPIFSSKCRSNRKRFILIRNKNTQLFLFQWHLKSFKYIQEKQKSNVPKNTFSFHIILNNAIYMVCYLCKNKIMFKTFFLLVIHKECNSLEVKMVELDVFLTARIIRHRLTVTFCFDTIGTTKKLNQRGLLAFLGFPFPKRNNSYFLLKNL